MDGTGTGLERGGDPRAAKPLDATLKTKIHYGLRKLYVGGGIISATEELACQTVEGIVASALAEAKAEIKRLREALKTIDTGFVHHSLTIRGAQKIARAALAGLPGKGKDE